MCRSLTRPIPTTPSKRDYKRPWPIVKTPLPIACHIASTMSHRRSTSSQKNWLIVDYLPHRSSLTTHRSQRSSSMRSSSPDRLRWPSFPGAMPRRRHTATKSLLSVSHHTSLISSHFWCQGGPLTLATCASPPQEHHRLPRHPPFHRNATVHW
jgi:hypothetical protein